MTIELRPHHLLCSLTYAGKGYSDAFTRSYDRIVARLNAGETVRIVEGPDALCAPVVAAEAEPHCFGDSVTRRDRDALESLEGLLRRRIAVGDDLALDAATTARLREAFASGAIRQACDGCQWSHLCSSIARRGFTGTALVGQAVPGQSNDRA
ncbi:DUF1284 domain-containing protein [Stappia sp.]|uniref:DUF1284 domain-containing protein n=1 Tax=Stappia sp. TaxID=1870903 RepID=UPI003C7C17A1